MGTTVIGERLVMPTTRKPTKTLHNPMLLRIDQLVSKCIGGFAADDIAKFEKADLPLCDDGDSLAVTLSRINGDIPSL